MVPELGAVRIDVAMSEIPREIGVVMNATAVVVVIGPVEKEVQARQKNGTQDIEHHAEQGELGPTTTDSLRRLRKNHAHRCSGTAAHQAAT